MVTGARASITERDLSVLRFVGEQYVVPMAVVGQLVDPEGRLAAGSVATVARRAAAGWSSSATPAAAPCWGSSG
jgi:hypothetical protein